VVLRHPQELGYPVAPGRGVAPAHLGRRAVLAPGVRCRRFAAPRHQPWQAEAARHGPGQERRPPPVDLDPGPAPPGRPLPVGPGEPHQRRQSREELVRVAGPGPRARPRPQPRRRRARRRQHARPRRAGKGQAQGQGPDVRVREVQQGVPPLDLLDQAPLGAHRALEGGEQAPPQQAPAGPAPRGRRHPRRSVGRQLAPRREVVLACCRVAADIGPPRRRAGHPLVVVRLASVGPVVAHLGRRRLRPLRARRHRVGRRGRHVARAAFGFGRGGPGDGERHVRARPRGLGRAPAAVAAPDPARAPHQRRPWLALGRQRLVVVARVVDDPARHALVRQRVRIGRPRQQPVQGGRPAVGRGGRRPRRQLARRHGRDAADVAPRVAAAAAPAPAPAPAQPGGARRPGLLRPRPAAAAAAAVTVVDSPSVPSLSSAPSPRFFQVRPPEVRNPPFSAPSAGPLPLAPLSPLYTR
ncbi:uncharacterized protein RHOBADRAFT_50770, partial [Rhodotorula graminis WP1]